MITKKDQDRLLNHVNALDSTLTDLTDDECKKAFGLPKNEVVQNQINALKHFIADLADYK